MFHRSWTMELPQAALQYKNIKVSRCVIRSYNLDTVVDIDVNIQICRSIVYSTCSTTSIQVSSTLCSWDMLWKSHGVSWCHGKTARFLGVSEAGSPLLRCCHRMEDFNRFHIVEKHICPYIKLHIILYMYVNVYIYIFDIISMIHSPF